jgi:hypothetical protein
VSIQFGLNQEAIQHDSAIRMTQVVQQFATMFVGRKVGVRLSNNTVAPAWSTSNTIEFSEPQLPDLQTADGVLSVRGLTFHELSHILFTPRAQSDIAIWVRDNSYGSAFNALEDQRIETLITARYGALKLWLTGTIAQHLFHSPQAISQAFPLVRGRKYLPVELRKLARDRYANPQDIDELASIIDEYRLLLFPQDTERAKPLIARYAELVRNLPEQGAGMPDPYGHSSRPDSEHHSSIKDKPLSKSEQERTRERAKAQDEQVEDEDEFNWGNPDQQDEDRNKPSDTDEQDTDSDGQPSDSESDSTDSDESASDSDSDSDSESDSTDSSDSDSDIDGEPTDNVSDSYGDGQSDNDHESDSTETSSGSDLSKANAEVRELMEDVLDSLKQSLGSAIADEVAKYGGDVVLQGIPAKTPRPAYNYPEVVSGGGVQASVAFKQELLKLKQEHDPSWDRKVRKGRLNPLRYAQGHDIDELFDKFEHGRDDAVDIEAVILLDTSGSMSGDNIRRANESLWGLKSALDAVNASCTAVTFSSDARLLYSADERVSSIMRFAPAQGGTDPLEALQYANHVLATSDRKVKVLFVITDGAWNGDVERAERIIKNLRDGGVVTALSYLGYVGESLANVDRHECEAVAHVTNASDLLEVGRSVVKLAIARNLVNA